MKRQDIYFNGGTLAPIVVVACVYWLIWTDDRLLAGRILATAFFAMINFMALLAVSKDDE